MTATVVIPTFRRPASLGRALAGLAGQVAPGVSWDVVVVDNDEPPGADAVLAAGRAALPVPAQLVREERRGASHARNCGLRSVSADIVVFMDDDVVPACDWLRELVAPIVAGRCDATGGRVVLDPSVARPRWFREGALGPYLAAHAPAEVERPVSPAEFLITASAAFTTQRLRSTGGFDVRLGPRGGVQLVNDDVLLCERFRQAGGRMHHVPRAVVVHELPPERLRPGYLLRRAFWQGRSDWVYQTIVLGRRGTVERQLAWLAHETRMRWAEGPWRVGVAFNAACDLARSVGAATEALAGARRHAQRRLAAARARS